MEGSLVMRSLALAVLFVALAACNDRDDAQGQTAAERREDRQNEVIRRRRTGWPCVLRIPTVRRGRWRRRVRLSRRRHRSDRQRPSALNTDARSIRIIRSAIRTIQLTPPRTGLGKRELYGKTRIRDALSTRHPG